MHHSCILKSLAVNFSDNRTQCGPMFGKPDTDMINKPEKSILTVINQ
ncbi:hypothetical protein SAMN03159342_05430 [Pseudomonas sp. NFPP04]|nr:hypothetical protein SAMN03159342_05430 [Pseudomonas sp. NFPP04]SFK00161.1 hypothetical protein SAMN03159344_05326 [Pseudomonas sp. NFPP11]